MTGGPEKMFVCAKGMLAPKNTSDRDGFEVSRQLIPDAWSANGEAHSPSLSLRTCV